MARRKTLPESVRAKYDLAERLRTIRAEMYGERGGPELARQLNLPVRTWYNYESGVTVPAEVILRIIELTSVEPIWLLHGNGPKFRSRTRDVEDAEARTSGSVGALLRTALQMLEHADSQAPTMVVSNGATQGDSEEHADVVLLAVDDSASEPIMKSSGPRYVAARSEWLDAEKECRCIRIVGNAMFPIVAHGAYVAFAKSEESISDLDGKMVIAWIDGQPIMRWFQDCGRYAMLRAENPSVTPGTLLIDLQDRTHDPRFRRVLWINTPH